MKTTKHQLPLAPTPEEQQAEHDRIKDMIRQAPSDGELQARKLLDPIFAAIAQGSTLKRAIAEHNGVLARSLQDSNKDTLSTHPESLSVGRFYGLLDRYPHISRIYLLSQRARSGVLLDQACELVESVNKDNVRVVDCKLRGLRWIVQSLQAQSAKADQRHEGVVRRSARVSIELLEPASDGDKQADRLAIDAGSL